MLLKIILFLVDKTIEIFDEISNKITVNELTVDSVDKNSTDNSDISNQSMRKEDTSKHAALSEDSTDPSNSNQTSVSVNLAMWKEDTSNQRGIVNLAMWKEDTSNDENDVSSNPVISQNDVSSNPVISQNDVSSNPVISQNDVSSNPVTSNEVPENNKKTLSQFLKKDLFIQINDEDALKTHQFFLMTIFNHRLKIAKLAENRTFLIIEECKRLVRFINREMEFTSCKNHFFKIFALLSSLRVKIFQKYGNSIQNYNSTEEVINILIKKESRFLKIPTTPWTINFQEKRFLSDLKSVLSDIKLDQELNCHLKYNFINDLNFFLMNISKYINVDEGIFWRYLNMMMILNYKIIMFLQEDL